MDELQAEVERLAGRPVRVRSLVHNDPGGPAEAWEVSWMADTIPVVIGRDRRFTTRADALRQALAVLRHV